MPNMSDEATFYATFDGDVSVTVTVNYLAFTTPGWIHAQWKGRPTPEAVSQYIAWMHTVMRRVALRLNRKVCYRYELPARGLPPLAFVYHPEGHYEPIRKPAPR